MRHIAPPLDVLCVAVARGEFGGNDDLRGYARLKRELVIVLDRYFVECWGDAWDIAHAALLDIRDRVVGHAAGRPATSATTGAPAPQRISDCLAELHATRATNGWRVR
jgi:hypothetical protein